MRREERVTVQGPIKEQQPDGMSHGGMKFHGWEWNVFSGGHNRSMLQGIVPQFWPVMLLVEYVSGSRVEPRPPQVWVCGGGVHPSPDQCTWDQDGYEPAKNLLGQQRSVKLKSAWLHACSPSCRSLPTQAKPWGWGVGMTPGWVAVSSWRAFCKMVGASF